MKQLSRGSRGQAARTLFVVLLAVSLLVPVLTAILNAGSETAYILDNRGRVPGEFGYSKVLGVRGGFAWRFFEWHIFGDSVTAIDWFLIDAFGLLPSAIIDVFNPTSPPLSPARAGLFPPTSSEPKRLPASLPMPVINHC